MEEYHAIFAERMIQHPGGTANLQYGLFFVVFSRLTIAIKTHAPLHTGRANEQNDVL